MKIPSCLQVGCESDIISWNGTDWTNWPTFDHTLAQGFGILKTPGGQIYINDDNSEYLKFNGTGFKSIYTGSNIAYTGCFVDEQTVWYAGLDGPLKTVCA